MNTIRLKITLRQSVKIIFVCFSLAFFAASIQYRRREIPAELTNLYHRISKHQSSSRSEECTFESLNPWDPSILEFIEAPRAPLKCKKIQDNLVTYDSKTRRLNIDFKIYNQLSNVECSYTPFEHSENVNDQDLKYGKKIMFDSSGLIMKHQFAVVNCDAGKLVKLSVFRREFVNPQELPTFRKNRASKVKSSSTTRPSVLVFGIDSTSNSNFKRQLPKTYDFINSDKNVEFLSYVKVWDNTYVNLLALLSGEYAGWSPEFKSNIPDEWDIYYDNVTKFIWEDFHENGYTTMMLEDRPDIHLFNFMGKLCGFKKQPVDLPFYLSIHGNWLHRRSTAYCYNDVPEHVVQLDVLKDFLHTHAANRYFAFSWLQGISHEFLNLPSVADGDFEAFFKDVQPVLNNTITIVISDHGHRYDSIRQTLIGRMESRLPYMSMIIPASIRRACPLSVALLEKNAARMTTAHDVHATMKTIADGSFCAVDEARAEEGEPRRNYSLLRENIPKHRTCHQAYIPEEFCPCVATMPLSIDEPIAQRAAVALIKTANAFIAGDASASQLCAPLTLDALHQASVEAPNQNTMLERETKNELPQNEGSYVVKFRVQLTAMPNYAQLEALLQYDFYANEYRLIGEIDRNNKYGNTSHCTTDRHLRKFCYCKDLL